MLILNPLKKFLKNAPKKVISKTSLTNMSKSRKSAYFCHIFANIFFCKDFKNFLVHVSSFFKLWSQTREKGLKKTENLFL